MWPCEACRVDPWSPIQRLYLQPGIVGKAGDSIALVDVLGLQQGIAL